MARARKSAGLSESFDVIPAEIEDEVLDAYGAVLENHPDEADLLLRDLPEVFEELRIPPCFTRAVCELINRYYALVGSKAALNLRDNHHLMVVFMIQYLTITDESNCQTINDCLDIVDVDKLVSRVGKLVKFRDHYRHILQTWKLFGCEESDVLTLPDLQRIKDQLNVAISDAQLIDMIGSGKQFNFEGTSVGITTFAEILGKLGEFD